MGNSFAKFIFNDRFMVELTIISHSSSVRQHEIIIKAGQLLQNLSGYSIGEKTWVPSSVICVTVA